MNRLILCFLLATTVGCDIWRGGPLPGQPDRPAPDFNMTDTSGKMLSKADLKGKVWIASFLFTRCTLGCPQVAETIKALQNATKDRSDFHLVTFTVDPDRDDADELNRYAAIYGADPSRWTFLRGNQQELDKLVHDGFQMAIQRDGSKPVGESITHPLKLVLIDRNGYIRSYFPGLPDAREAADVFPTEQQSLRAQIDILLRERPWTGWFIPSAELNALLNGLAGIFLVSGFIAIRTGNRGLHGGLMMAALTTSALFLASYLTYHLLLKHGVATSFASRAPSAPAGVHYAYLGILLTHTVLAIVITPMALYVASLGLRGGSSLPRHKALARWTFPLWLYVAVTGVVVYWMLYRLPGAAGWN